MSQIITTTTVIPPYGLAGIYVTLSGLAITWFYTKFLEFAEEVGVEPPSVLTLEVAILLTTIVCVLTQLLGPLGAVLSLILVGGASFFLYSHLLYVLAKDDKIKQGIDRIYYGEEDFIYLTLIIASYPIIMCTIILVGLSMRF